MSLFFRRAALLAGMLTVLAMLSLSPAAQAPARSAFDILEVGRWSNPPKKVNPLAAHHTYHSAAMNCDVGYTIYLPPNYAASVRCPSYIGCQEVAAMRNPTASRLPKVCWLGLTRPSGKGSSRH